MTLTAVQFAARLKLAAASPGTAATGSPPSQPSSNASSPREKSWAQKRKESFIARRARPPPTEAEVAVSAVRFAAKLKQRTNGGASPSRNTAPTSTIVALAAAAASASAQPTDGAAPAERGAISGAEAAGEVGSPQAAEVMAASAVELS